MGRLDAAALIAVFEAAVDSLIVIDERGVIQAMNTSALENFGYVEEQLLGEGIAMLMPEPDASRHDQYVAHYRATGERKILGIGREVTGRRSDGTTFPMHLSISEFRSEGQRLFLGICHDITERREFTDRISAMARIDALTGCANRSEGIRFLDDLIAAPDAAAEGIALLFVDLDDFKQVNDNHGHSVGDIVLREAASRIASLVPEGGMLARMGGDEFLVVVPLEGALATASQVAERIVHEVAVPIPVESRHLRLGACVGISRYPRDADSAEELISLADIAMYDAKRGHRSPVRLFDPVLKQRAERNYATLSRLQQGIEDGAFELHYQLQFDVMTLEPTGIEALVRWRDPVRGLVAPGEWMDLALQWGLTPAIGRWVIDRACRDNARLIAEGVLDVPVAINICAPLFGERDFVDVVTSAMATHGLPVDRIELEVVESVAMTPTPVLAANVEAIRRAGISLAMDDFGTGFSSLQLLNRGTFSQLKVDRSFVGRLPGTASDRTIVSATIDLARSLGLTTVAEGVEEFEQLELLREMGCDRAQGYWYARPQPYDALVAAVAELPALIRSRGLTVAV
ncbi:bifunctional diguanylate cyclase/phosphodiesterase [Nocardioides sp.]|uniref:putative bifunctional diguanylate cyclase/phosphodiesterase n=1 Tax=Nocardioides sp. TaxID=35761 RepID=UPI0026105631|nr:GGDEF domain-containing phosphodiesterase [Nocardioides sp.]